MVVDNRWLNYDLKNKSAEDGYAVRPKVPGECQEMHDHIGTKKLYERVAGLTR